MKHSICLTIACAVLAAGCDAVPSVSYQVVNGPDLTGLNKFSFQSSLITIDVNKDDKGNVIPDSYVAKSVPAVDPSGTLYSIQPSSSQPGVETSLKMVPQANSTLISSIGTTVTDNRVKDIQTVASIIAAVAPAVGALALAPAAPSPVPATIDVSRIHLTPAHDDGKEVTIHGQLNGSANYTYTIVYSAVPKDAVPIKDYPFGTSQSVLPYSACRTATITLKLPSSSAPALTVTSVLSATIADPNFLETIALPANGTVTMQSSCGVSVTSQAATTSSTLDIVNALVSAAGTIRSAEAQKPAAQQTK